MDARPAGRSLLRWWIPYSVLAVCVLLTVAASYDLASSSHAKDRLRFRTEVEKTQESIQNRLETYVAMLRATAGLFAASRSVSRENFRDFVARLELQRRYPGIQGLGFSRFVPARDRDTLVAAMHRAGDPSFRIWPEGERTDYHAILHLEPLDRRNQVAIGYDMSTEPVRRAAMERARDTGLPAASGKVTLVQELDAAKQAGFLIYVPVYDSPTTPETVAERRALLRGFVYVPFRADDLLAGIFGGDTRPDLAFDVFASSEPAPDTLLHRSSPLPGRRSSPRFATTRVFDVAGAPWSLAFTTLPAFEAAAGRGQVTALLLVGLVTSGALFVVIRSQVRARAAAERVALDLHRSEDALRESEERTGLILANALDSVITMDRDGLVTSWNAGAEALTGWSASEVLGRPLAQTIIPPPFREAHRRGLERYLATGQGVVLNRRIEVTALRRDGTECPVELSITPLHARGSITFSAFVRDITDRKRAETELREMSDELERRVVERTAQLEAAREELVRKERLAVLGQLAGGVSHELRNPLGVMSNAVYYLRLVAADDERVHKHLRILEREVGTVNRIVSDLLDYARVKPAVRVPTALAPLARAVLERLRIPSNVKVTFVLDEDLEPVAADPGQIEQILSNLVMNGIQAMPDGGTLTIATGRVDGAAQVAVSDSGVGIPPESMDKLFQPLFTTKARGIGLGLAIVKALTESNEATISVETELGRGSRFTVRFAGSA